MTDIDKLREMVASYPGLIQDLEEQSDGLQDIITDLSEQQQAIENEVMAPLLVDSDAYLVIKASSLTVSGSCFGSCNVCTSGGYGVSNLTDWAIVSGGCPPMPHNVVWDSSDVLPSGTTRDAAQYWTQVDFATAYGHIHDDVGTTYGTYGIEDNIINVGVGKSITDKNKTKYEEVLSIYDQYT